MTETTLHFPRGRKTVCIIAKGHTGATHVIYMEQRRTLPGWVRLVLKPVELIVFGAVVGWMMFIGFRFLPGHGFNGTGPA